MMAIPEICRISGTLFLRLIFMYMSSCTMKHEALSFVARLLMWVRFIPVQRWCRCHSCQIALIVRDVWDHDIYPVQHYPRPYDCIVCFYDYNIYDGEKYLRFTKMHVEDDAMTTSIPGRFRCISCTKSLEQLIRHQLPGADFLGAACREKSINYCRCENGVCDCGFQDKA